MKNHEDVENLEKLIVQLTSLHSEISQLAKKSPNDGLNVFKLKLVNKVLKAGNAILTPRYIPFEDFECFEEDSLPTNSDVTMILAQYMEQAERFRSDHMVYHTHNWYYKIDGEASNIRGNAPTRIGGVKK